MKKILTFALALLTAISITSCVGTGSTDNGEAQARAAADGFMSGVCDFDFEKASEYSNYDFVEAIGFANIVEFRDSFIAEAFGGDETLSSYENEVIAAFDPMLNYWLDTLDYEIVGSSFEDGKWSYDVEISSINITEVSAALSSEVVSELTSELVDKYTEDIMSASDEEAQMEIIDRVLKELFERIGDILLEASENAQINTVEGNVVVINSDGEWIVDGNDGNLDAFVDLFS